MVSPAQSMVKEQVADGVASQVSDEGTAALVARLTISFADSIASSRANSCSERETSLCTLMSTTC